MSDHTPEEQDFLDRVAAAVAGLLAHHTIDNTEEGDAYFARKVAQALLAQRPKPAPAHEPAKLGEAERLRERAEAVWGAHDALPSRPVPDAVDVERKDLWDGYARALRDCHRITFDYATELEEKAAEIEALRGEGEG